MRIGSLNKRITLQSRTRVSDGMGGFNSTWSDIVTLWAAVWPVSAKEIIQADASIMLVSHRIRVRYKSGLMPSYRIKFGSRYFNIVSIINQNEGGRWIDIMCKEAA